MKELMKQRQELMGLLEEYRTARICYDKQHVRRLKAMLQAIDEKLRK